MSDAQAAAAQAPAPEGMPEISEEQALSEAFDRLTAEGIEPGPEPEEAPAPEAEAAEEPEAAEDAPEPEADEAPEDAEVPEMPPVLPANLKAAWAQLSPENREAVQQSFQKLNVKMAEQGRVVQAVKPIHDVLMQALESIPTIQHMTPDQLARDVFQMASIQGQMAQDPVGTLLGIAQHYGALDGIRHVLTGQGDQQASAQTQQMAQEIRRLQALLQQQMNPDAIEQRVMSSITKRELTQMVGEYAKGKELWGDVQQKLPRFIPDAIESLGPSASAQDVLDLAYDMAVHAIPDLRAKVLAAAPAPARPDPERTAAQRRAKSVNVTSRTAGQPRAMSEEDALAAAYDRAASR